MDAAQIITLALVLINIGFGLIGYLKPHRTMAILGLETIDGRLDGLSEIRAASGAVFAVAGIGALLLATPAAYAMVGFIYLGGAIGRITSIVADGSGSRLTWSFFVVEAIFAAWLIGANISI